MNSTLKALGRAEQRLQGLGTATPTAAPVRGRHHSLSSPACCRDSLAGRGRWTRESSVWVQSPTSSPSVAAARQPSDREALLQLLHEKRQGSSCGPGHVHLVGTGPGDPSLLTMRALQLMQTADVILYDRLVSDEILQYIHPEARMVYVGKQKGYHTRTQEEIHQLLLDFAEAGATVVRLKGGDPFVFGRGGEEMHYLEQRGITVHCVPGITAASGICADLGIPMTHRGVATSARFLTGHSQEGLEDMLDETIVASADNNTTLIVYMGLQTLPVLEKQLIGHGMDPKTPAVAVERGTMVDQRVVYATLDGLKEKTHEVKLKSPTLLIIGKVVALCPGWHSQKQGQQRPHKELAKADMSLLKVLEKSTYMAATR